MENQDKVKIDTQNNEQDIVPITYQGIPGITFEYTDPATNERWIQQVVGEHMLDVRWKQFDRYCDALDPKVEKRRIKTKRYSYNFIKESDVHRIAETFNKVIRIPIKDIPRTDENKKIFSQTDVGTLVEGEVNHRGMEVFNEFKDIIKNLESRNETLHTEVNSLVKEKSRLEIEKNEIVTKKQTWKGFAIFFGAALVVGGVWGGIYKNNIDVDNDRLDDEKSRAVKIAVSLNTENNDLNLKNKLLGDEVETLKDRIPVTQNEEINAVKKD